MENQHDIFNEKLVARIPTWKTVLAKTGIVLLAAAIIVFAVLTLLSLRNVVGYFFPFVVVGAGYGAWFLVRRFNIEYEYSITNDSMDIDKIIAQSSRKNLLTMDLHFIEEAGPADGAAFARVKEMDFDSIADYTSHVQAPGRWYIIYSQDGKRNLIFLEPSEKMIRSFRTYAPNALPR